MNTRDPLVSADKGVDSPGEQAIDRSLRPVSLGEFVGQPRMRE